MSAPTPEPAPTDPMATATTSSTAASEPDARPNAAGVGGARAAAPQPPGMLDALQSIWHELPGLVSDRVDLLSLELQRASRALAQVVAVLVAAAILGVTAWLTLCAGVAVGLAVCLVELGLHWALSLLLVLVLETGLAVVAIDRLRNRLPLLSLPASRRNLTARPITAPTAAPPPSATADTHAALGQAGRANDVRPDVGRSTASALGACVGIIDGGCYRSPASWTRFAWCAIPPVQHGTPLAPARLCPIPTPRSPT